MKQRKIITVQDLGEIVHDFNNALGTLRGYSELLSECELDETSAKYAAKIKLAKERLLEVGAMLDDIYSAQRETQRHDPAWREFANGATRIAPERRQKRRGW